LLTEDCGGRNRTRTCDPIDVNDVLYHSGSFAWKNYGSFRLSRDPLYPWADDIVPYSPISRNINFKKKDTPVIRSTRLTDIDNKNTIIILEQ